MEKFKTLHFSEAASLPYLEAFIFQPPGQKSSRPLHLFTAPSFLALCLMCNQKVRTAGQKTTQNNTERVPRQVKRSHVTQKMMAQVSASMELGKELDRGHEGRESPNESGSEVTSLGGSQADWKLVLPAGHHTGPVVGGRTRPHSPQRGPGRSAWGLPARSGLCAGHTDWAECSANCR